MEQLDDKEKACLMFRKVAERMPGAEVGMCARERMHGDKPTMKHPEPEKPWYMEEDNDPEQEKEILQDEEPFFKKCSEAHGKTAEESETLPSLSDPLADEMPGDFSGDDTK